MRLTGKNAIVTGASRGIGAAIARALAREGARVVLNYARSRDAASALAAELGGVAVEADLSETGAAKHLFDAAEAAIGPIDIVVNNAGIAIFKAVAEITDEEYERMFALNARGVFEMMREAARRVRDGGRVVSISSGATVNGSRGSSIYCGSKAAVEQFSRALAHELGKRGVTVNTVSPGFTFTDMLRQIPRLVEIGPGMSPMGRLGQPEDVADVIAWLCTDEARWVTGQNIQAGGGASMV
jgi:3-oxoacyl-[acyl-carrier protein] reductase